LEKWVNFNSGDKEIEGIIYLPAESGIFPGVIVLHPHPAFGGSMENNVVNAVCNELSKNGIVAFKFNIRDPNIKKAVEHSKNALDFFLTTDQLNDQLDVKRIGVCGYSWGSRVILEAFYKDPKVKFLIGISPPLSMMKFDFLLESDKPKLITVGTQDQFIPLNSIQDFFDKLKEPKEFAVLNTDHIYVGVEKKLSTRILEFVKKYI